MDLHELTIAAAQSKLHSGELSAVELTRAVLARIEAVEPRIDAYISVTGDTALEMAAAADARLARGEGAPLTGIPLGVKDLICTAGIPTTCASRILENFVPPYDATVIQRLKAQDAVLVGKLNMDEFAMGSTTEHSAFKVTRNPWNRDRIPGGSSGGSAAAVAAGMCLGALGSDTGGSIRQPASHCGVVGLKPSYGRVSRYGLVAFASSLDQIGPLTRSVTDCAILFEAIAGYDPSDSTSVNRPVPDSLSALADGVDLRGVRVGLPLEYHRVDGLDPDVAAATSAAAETLTELGAVCVEVSLPHTPYAVAAYYVIAPSEASSNLARYDGVKYGHRDTTKTGLMEMYRGTRSTGFGAEVQRRIILGTYSLSSGYYDAYYGKASQVRTLIRRDFEAAFEQCDVLLAPVAPTPAGRIGESVDDPLAMYLSDIFTLSANLAGIPGISIPCGLSKEGLPIGLQLMAAPFEEARLLTTARAFEQATHHHEARPAV
ncbi:MAG: Asp-tRNA(Asn)/Glu-tRNA(Gln) amidotransferase subunit GatA [Desulfosarcinaceae bacterium]|nr:Asp-tRNA(Asn)/Glu-tRNA(Gln) amidotransferase subunit GatA [Desulfosarcinaceae bacterium]